MGVCRRIFKHYEPCELTICVTIFCEPRLPPKFDKWNISKPGYPPKIISCLRGAALDENREKRSRRKVVKRRKKSDVSEKSLKSENNGDIDNLEEVQKAEDKPLLHSDSATLISDNVVTMTSTTEISEAKDTVEFRELTTDSEIKRLEPRDRHVSITSLDSVAGLGGMTSLAEDSDGGIISKAVNEAQNSEDEKTTSEEVNARREDIPQKDNGKQFDLLSNGDVVIPTIEIMMKDVAKPKKKLMIRRKKKSTTPDSPPRYRDFTETSIHMYIEMNKQNVGEFVWDQQCTRIDALVAPIIELDRTTTPEIPIEVEILD